MKIVEVMLILGMGIFTYDFVNRTKNFDNTLLRREAGSGNISYDMKLRVEDKTQKVIVDVSSMPYTKNEADALFEEAINEIETTIKGENEGLDKVMYDLDIKSSYCDGRVAAKFVFSDTELVSEQGKIFHENFDESTVVKAEAVLTLEDYEEHYLFDLNVVPWDPDTKKGFDYYLQETLKKMNEENPAREKVILPEIVAGKPLDWKLAWNLRGLEIVALAIAVALLLPLLEGLEKKEASRKLKEARLRDYPMIVSELSILIGSGMSVKSAFERITKRYVARRGQKDKKEGYELMVTCFRRMSEGVGEAEAIELMGKQSEVKEYRKLAMLLSHNIKKGSRDLITSLETEEACAFELRKHLALKAGEEASTKLLVPMGGMLLIVLVILMVPAILQVNL
ncbi:MAG: hypothetical protein HUJ98_10010 [Bacteroidaceae bacterium]|nr:hypothetical protein [Bacteroidaceae bacterium]